MKTHYVPVKDSAAMREVIDERDIFECSKGHKWGETLLNRFNIFSPLNFPIPNGDSICPFCLSEFLQTLGRVTWRTEKLMESNNK